MMLTERKSTNILKLFETRALKAVDKLCNRATKPSDYILHLKCGLLLDADHLG